MLLHWHDGSMIRTATHAASVTWKSCTLIVVIRSSGHLRYCSYRIWSDSKTSIDHRMKSYQRVISIQKVAVKCLTGVKPEKQQRLRMWNLVFLPLRSLTLKFSNKCLQARKLSEETLFQAPHRIMCCVSTFNWLIPLDHGCILKTADQTGNMVLC